MQNSSSLKKVGRYKVMKLLHSLVFIQS